jgi:hypothetical protein
MSGGFWAGSIPPWAWVLYVCAAGIFIILVLAAGMSGRRRGYDAGYDDGVADERNRPRSIRRMVPPGERTAAFLNPPEVAHEWPMPPGYAQERDEAMAQAWLAHTDLALDLANQPDFSVTAWTQEAGEKLDAWLEEHVYSVPIPYLPGEDRE